MKRWFAALLTLALLLSPLTPRAAAASGKAVPVLVSLSSAEGEAGERVTVEVSLSRMIWFANLSLQIGYDADALTLTGVAMRDGAKLSETSQTLDVNPYVLVWANAGNVRWEAGVIAALTFAIREDAPKGESPVTVDFYHGRGGAGTAYRDGEQVNFRVLNGDKTPLRLSYQGGSVTVAGEDCEIASLTREGGGIIAQLVGDAEQGDRLLAARYGSGGQLRELKLTAWDAAPRCVFDGLETGDTVKLFWLSPDGVPRCAARSMTIQ